MLNFLDERQRVDRRRVEDAFFQFALLKAASWYPSIFNISKLPLHAKALETISNFTTVYHGAFMAKYSGKSISVTVDLLRLATAATDFSCLLYCHKLTTTQKVLPCCKSCINYSTLLLVLTQILFT